MSSPVNQNRALVETLNQANVYRSLKLLVGQGWLKLDQLPLWAPADIGALPIKKHLTISDQVPLYGG